ncbi:MAG: hypothetical protein H0U53_02395 [Actinobacteria bacterium]|nr:hypothetical protein [Actinomycetota bacterium]
MSLVNTPEAPVAVASTKSVDYLVALVGERIGKTIDSAMFTGLGQKDVSDMINVENSNPATDAQIVRVAELAKRLKRGTLVSKDRGQAARQINAMEADLAKIRANRKPVSDDRKQNAASLLDTLLGQAAVAATPVTDSIPF